MLTGRLLFHSNVHINMLYWYNLTRLPFDMVTRPVIYKNLIEDFLIFVMCENLWCYFVKHICHYVNFGDIICFLDPNQYTYSHVLVNCVMAM